jgi:cytochrome bd-type quinol oxidase subunit 2
MNKDISSDLFYAEWPAWIRWGLFIPTALIGCILITIIFNILTGIFVTSQDNSTLNHGWYRLLSSALMGAAFVGIAAYVAPKKQMEIGIGAFVVMAILLAMLWMRSIDYGLLHKTSDNLYQIMHSVAAIAGGVAALFGVKEELSNRS